MNTDDVLTERGKRYGIYLNQTKISDALLKALMETTGGKWYELETDQRDAITMIFVKIARIMNGDPDYADNYSDIAGYARLVEERLMGITRE